MNKIALLDKFMYLIILTINLTKSNIVQKTRKLRIHAKMFIKKLKNLVK